MKVLFISAWFPNRYDSMSGLCVYRHAKAISGFADVKVLYVHSDSELDKFEITDTKANNLHEIIVYYPAKNGNIFRKIVKNINYLRAYKKGYNYLKKNYSFTPDIVHANVLTRTGVMTYLNKLRTKTPYVISEHFSRYLPARNEYNGKLRKVATKKVVKNASAILPVSEILEEALLSHHLYNPNYVVSYNVVDDIFLKEYPVVPREKKRILHVSCFHEGAKNVKGILNATKKISGYRNDFELVIIGCGKDYDEIYDYAASLNLLGVVQFKGELLPQEVVGWFQNSDFFVLFSNYETASVVIAESLCSGKPVVTSRVGGASEWISEENGLIVDPKDEVALEESMNYMLDHFQEYNSELIKEKARKKFSYETIGKKIYNIYKQAIAKS